MWSDSCTFLHWLQKRGQYRQFVEHRVKEIEQLSRDSKWQYCPTAQNPADLGTRGKTPLQLKGNELWWREPIWLTSEEWPEQPILEKGKEVEDEEIKTVLQVTRAVNLSCEQGRSAG